jgi:hypothetical protein
METTPYKGKVSGMKTSPWLASEDLEGLGKVGGSIRGSVNVNISGVFRNENVTLDAGRVEKCLFSVAFHGVEKQMILNATNRKTLTKAFGADTKKWIGGEIELIAQDGIQKPGAKKGILTTGLRFVSGASAKPRDLNSEIGLQEKPKPSPAVETKPQPEATPANQEEEEIELEEIDHGDD